MSAQVTTGSSIEAKVDRLQDDLARLQGNVQGRLSSESIAKILLIFWGVLSVGFAVFGIKSLNDIKSNIKLVTQNELDAYVLQKKDNLKDLRVAIEDATTRQKAFLESHADQMDLLLHLKEVSNEVIASDLEGRVDRLILEAGIRASAQAQAIQVASLPGISEEQRAEVLSTTTLDPSWRSKAMGTLTRLDELLGTGANFDPNKLFNVTQVAREIGAFDTANRLANHLVRRYATPAYRAVALNSRIRIAKDAKEVESGFDELMGLVAALGPQEPQIVLAEAWNGAEYLRRYADFVSAIERLEQTNQAASAAGTPSFKALPSYAYVIKAQALLRHSSPGSVERARAALARATEVLRTESTHSQWYGETIRDGTQVAELLEASSKMGTNPFEAGTEDASSMNLEDLLRQLSEIEQIAPDQTAPEGGGTELKLE